MISEGSCDTEDWSNDAEIQALPSIFKYIKTENISNCNNISQFLRIFFSVFLIKQMHPW